MKKKKSAKISPVSLVFVGIYIFKAHFLFGYAEMYNMGVHTTFKIYLQSQNTCIFAET